MRTGRSNLLVGRAGEYLVAAELSRRGLIATTFAGNVPHYDIIASDERGRHVSIQVKTSRSASWQFADLRQYCDITFDGERQMVGDMKACPVRGLVVACVKIDTTGRDRFYILTWRRLRDILVDHHKAYLARHGGIRPKRAGSLHCAITESLLSPYEGKWTTIAKNLR